MAVNMAGIHEEDFSRQPFIRGKERKQARLRNVLSNSGLREGLRQIPSSAARVTH